MALLAAACSSGEAREEAASKPRVGLFSSLPLYWGEGEFGAMLEGGGHKDWVREELETRFDLVPLDTLEPEALEGLDRVILAQPRALAPSENVSFDQWVVQGGQAVILADPMLTRHSRYPIGDRRRPQDVVLLSPIFAHWGLELLFDETQPGGERTVKLAGQSVPVALHGRFARQETSSCTVLGDGLLARCARGSGAAVLFADAALLDWEGSDRVPQGRKDALWAVLKSAIPDEPAATD
ncbi:GldG family protein [Qipengyuania sp. SS22]|uniref:GldG family protein n=1 Tax=Qipengyuania sp. SS22 TaxID=2979461 RepID=UPI0021E5E157|nr:GldG family protein [Qipengyuania sp. SS22]UYH55231.1 GldG family protein [Qipengyuania sp. SS22]